MRDGAYAPDRSKRRSQAVIIHPPGLSGYTVYVSGPESAMPEAETLLQRGLPQEQLHIDYMQRFRSRAAPTNAVMALSMDAWKKLIRQLDMYI